MNVTGVGARSSLVVQSLGDMRTQLGDLQRQLGTGKKSTTYAGLGIDRGLAVGLRSRLSAMASYRRDRHAGRRADQSAAGVSDAHLRPRPFGEIRDTDPVHHRLERPDRDAAHRERAARRDPRPAQHAGRRPLPVLGPRGRQAGDRDARSHPQRRREPRRLQAGDGRAAAGRSRRERPRPPHAAGDHVRGGGDDRCRRDDHARRGRDRRRHAEPRRPLHLGRRHARDQRHQHPDRGGRRHHGDPGGDQRARHGGGDRRHGDRPRRAADAFRRRRRHGDRSHRHHGFAHHRVRHRGRPDQSDQPADARRRDRRADPDDHHRQQPDAHRDLRHRRAGACRRRSPRSPSSTPRSARSPAGPRARASWTATSPSRARTPPIRSPSAATCRPRPSGLRRPPLRPRTWSGSPRTSRAIRSASSSPRSRPP